MKLLFDENLSRKLVVRLAELYPESAHVAEVDLIERPDREIWEFAKAGNFVIVSADSLLRTRHITRAASQGRVAPALDASYKEIRLKQRSDRSHAGRWNPGPARAQRPPHRDAGDSMRKNRGKPNA